MELEYNQTDDIISARINGTAEEVAAFALEIQRQRLDKVKLNFGGDVSRLAKILATKGDTGPGVPEK